MPYTEVFEYGYRHGRQVKNFLVDVTAHGYDNLSRVLDIVFSDICNVPGFVREKRVTHFQTDGTFQLTLFIEQPKTNSDLIAEPFPSPMNSQEALDFVWNWLEEVPYPSDEHDGGAEKGWRVFNETFGLVGKNWQSLVAIRPMWIYIPK